MITLTGKSLNERHKELNSKVNAAAVNAVPFENIKSQSEKTDVDRLFKIDLANKYKNLDYIIETLKCGDSLFITRALKCTWLYDDELSTIVSPDYLEQHIFPEMSFKMKRVFLKMIAQNVNNNDRSVPFFNYCIQKNLSHIALKFLVNTSEAFKIEIIKEQSLYISKEDRINIVGQSFVLATTILNKLYDFEINNYLRSLCYLYSVSEVEYLDLLEKYVVRDGLNGESGKRLGLRISKHITKNYKGRLLCHTSLYLNLLNVKILLRYSTPDDVKTYITNLFPTRCSEFWDFYKKYEFIIEVIPFHERLQYIKDIFKKYYPGENFEMSIQFYHTGLYKCMTKTERESWALKHIEEGLEHFGHGQDFIWYKFVSFGKAYEPIKKYILISANADMRTSAINVLVSSAHSNRDLETLFNYYYQRFVNEMRQNKEKFVDEVLSIHNCFDFDEDCWNAFDKILHSMDVYDNMTSYSCKSEYKLIVIIHNIICEKELHEALKKDINDGINLYQFKQLTDKLPKDKVEMVYQFIMDYYLDKINRFASENYNDEVKYNVRNYIHNLLDLMLKYNKSIKDIPEIVTKLVDLDKEEYKYNSMFKTEETYFNQFFLIKDLKKDASLVVSKIPMVKEELKNMMLFDLTFLLRKIKIYFSNDIALKYIDLYKELLASNELYDKTTDAAVYGILHLAEKDDIVDFVTKYIPDEPKIDHVNIERKLLYIRTAICKFMWVSRPIIPLSIVKKYIVGDYLKLCLPMFHSYEANLQPGPLAEFVKFLLKSPASIQKHGIRMTFQCFSINDLKVILSDIWNKTKNVSLRLVMYKLLHDKIVKQQDNHAQSTLFEVFKMFTLDACEDDDDELFTVMTETQLPSHILGEHILSAWQVLTALPSKHIMVTRQSAVITNMANHIGLIQQDVIDSIVCEHIEIMLKQGQIKCRNKNESHISGLTNAKWNLTAKYLMYLPSKDILEQKLNIVKTIVNECIKLWNDTEDKVYIVRPFFMDFIRDIESNICFRETTHCLHGILLLQEIIKHLLEGLPLVEIYDTIWYLRLSVIVANTISDARRLFTERGSKNESLIFSESIDKFANDFTSLVNEFIEGNIYIPSAISVIKRFLARFANILLNNWPSSLNHCYEHIISEICSKLIQLDKFETNKIALELWPVSYMGHMNINFMNKIKSSDNKELNYLLYRNFVSENYYISTPFV